MRLFSQDTKVEALKRAPLFQGLSRKELVQLARLSDDLEVAPGKVLCKEGETGQEFFVIIDGKVEVKAKGRRVASLGAGDFVGEIALLERIPRTATVTAETPLRFRPDARVLPAPRRPEPDRGAQALAGSRPAARRALARSDAGIAPLGRPDRRLS